MVHKIVLLHCMKTIQRNTEVVSVSLPKKIAKTLDRIRERRGQSRSAFVASLIRAKGEEERWRQIYDRGSKTALSFKITSEDDIDRILHEK